MLDGKKTFSELRLAHRLRALPRARQEGDFNKSPNGTTFEQQQAMVGSGKAAMAIQVTSVATGIIDAAKDKADIATFPFPAADDAADLKIPAGVSRRASARARTASTWRRPRSSSTGSAQPAQMADVRGGQPVDPARRAPSRRRLSDIAKPFAPFLTEGKTVPFMDQQWPNAKVQPAHFAGVQELFAGQDRHRRAAGEARRGVPAEVSTTHPRATTAAAGRRAARRGAAASSPTPARRRCGSPRRRC